MLPSLMLMPDAAAVAFCCAYLFASLSVLQLWSHDVGCAAEDQG